MDRVQSSDFDAEGRAPDTDGLAEMREANVSEDADILREAMSDFACDVISDDLIDVTHLNKCVLMDGDGELPKTKRLGQILRDKGFKQIKSRCLMIAKKKHYIWINQSKVTEVEAKKAVRDFHAGEQDFTQTLATQDEIPL